MSVFLVWHIKAKAVIEVFATYEDAKNYVKENKIYMIDEREVM